MKRHILLIFTGCLLIYSSCKKPNQITPFNQKGTEEKIIKRKIKFDFADSTVTITTDSGTRILKFFPPKRNRLRTDAGGATHLALMLPQTNFTINCSATVSIGSEPQVEDLPVVKYIAGVSDVRADLATTTYSTIGPNNSVTYYNGTLLDFSWWVSPKLPNAYTYITWSGSVYYRSTNSQRIPMTQSYNDEWSTSQLVSASSY